MNCPACQNDLETRIANDVTLDVCDGGCGGIWFDAFEFRKFDSPHAPGGEALADIARDPALHVNQDAARTCPLSKCDNVPLMRHFWSFANRVEIDTCPSCGGVWLDAEELCTIRKIFASDEEHRQYSQQVINEAFEASRESTRADDTPQFLARVGRLFSFLSDAA